MEQILNYTPEEFLLKEININEILQDYKNWLHIPSVNHVSLQNLKDGSFVRFRGMIQDMLDPEFYLEKYEVVARDNGKRIRMQQGKYRDCLVLSTEENVNHDCRDNVHGERRTLFLVSIPGLNDWALEVEKKNLPNIENDICSEKNIKVNKGVKRSCEDMQAMEIDQPIYGNVLANKKVKSDETNNIISENFSSSYLINSPISDRPGKACMVKIYKEFEENTLNTLVEVIGFLSVDPALDGSTIDIYDFEDPVEFQAANPPPSLIPRIHAVAVRKLLHSNPLLDASITGKSLPEIDFDMESRYKDLKIVLTQCLFGDSLVADYLISHLISTVYVRTNLEVLGQFSLNIYNIPREVYKKYTEHLYNIIESILPTSHYLPMTLENLNEKQFTPKKDYTTNKLISGLLQLAPHTHLVLDETHLQPGKLENTGVKAVQSLARLIKNQQIKYNFEYYELDFDTNIPVLILSEGKSMLPSNFQIPLNPDPESISLIEETLKAAKHYLQPKLDDIRIYLTLAKLSEFKLKQEESKMIENDFVKMRKVNPKTDADILHKHLVLSRLHGIARGKKIFDSECWENVKIMEAQRNERNNKLSKK